MTIRISRLAANASQPSSKISGNDLNEAKGLMAQQATLLVEGKFLKSPQLKIADQKTLQAGSFDGSASESKLLKMTSGLLIDQENVNDGGSTSSGGEHVGGFSDSRNFLLMNRQGFQFAVANGKASPADADRVKFIKSQPDSMLTQKNIKPGVDAVLFNGSELYTVVNKAGRETWTKVALTVDGV